MIATILRVKVEAAEPHAMKVQIEIVAIPTISEGEYST